MRHGGGELRAGVQLGLRARKVYNASARAVRRSTTLVTPVGTLANHPPLTSPDYIQGTTTVHLLPLGQMVHLTYALHVAAAPAS